MRSHPIALPVVALALVVPGAWATAEAPAAAAPAAVALNACASSDNGDPALTGVTIGPAVIDARTHSRVLTVRVTGTDDGGPGPALGIQEVRVSLNRGVGGDNPVRLRPAGDGTWVGSARVAPWTRAGTRSVNLVWLSDGVNEQSYSRSWLATHNMATPITIRSRPDVRPPKVSDVKVSPRSLDTRLAAKTVHVAVRVSDTGTGVDTGVVRAYNTVINTSVEARLRPGAGSRWSGDLRIPRWQGNARWQLGLELTDAAGNGTFLSSYELDNNLWPDSLRVHSVRDSDRPKVRSFRLSPGAVDVRGQDALVTVTARLTDAQSGLARAVVRDPRGDERTMRLVSGTRHDGLWRATVRVQRCEQTAGPVRLMLTAQDAANMGVRHSATLAVQNGDISAPEVSLVPDRPRADGPVGLRFSEPVAGISAASAVVREVQYSDEWPTDPQPGLPGAWACVDAAGVAVDCTVGPVTSATFRPTTPLAEGDHLIDFNPEHILAVTDLAGNPLGGFMFWISD